MCLLLSGPQFLPPGILLEVCQDPFQLCHTADPLIPGFLSPVALTREPALHPSASRLFWYRALRSCEGLWPPKPQCGYQPQDPPGWSRRWGKESDAWQTVSAGVTLIASLGNSPNAIEGNAFFGKGKLGFQIWFSALRKPWWAPCSPQVLWPLKTQPPFLTYYIYVYLVCIFLLRTMIQYSLIQC